ncbi:hypothetical protein D3C80_1324600 [compost metagenome]
MLRKKQTAQGTKFRRDVQVYVFLAFGIAEHQMGVDIHQPGHDEVSASVNHAFARQWLRSALARADMGEHTLFDDQHLVVASLVLKPSKERLAVNVESGHGGLSCCCRANTVLGSRCLRK